MQKHYTPKGKHLTMDNRRLIERWKNENMSNCEIAGLLGKAPQTINNEVKRGTTLQQVRKGLYKKVYSADYAQTVYQINRKRSVKKIIPTKELKEKIVHYTKQKFSPEMMVKKKKIKVGISTIYFWFHNGHLGLTKLIPVHPYKTTDCAGIPHCTDGNLYSLANSHISAAYGTVFCHLSELFPEEYICCNSYPLHGKDGVY